MTIPKIIHTYWEGKSNELAKICFKRMRELNPDWTLMIHNNKSLKKINKCPKYELNTPQFNSDLVRLYYILHEGGVWFDSTCYCIKPIDSFIDLNSDKVQGFSVPWQSNCLENWFIASCPQNVLIRYWYNEYIRARNIGFENYKKQLPDCIKKEPIYEWLPYLTMHACYRMVVIKTKNKAKLSRSKDGPYQYINKHNWNSVHACIDICSTNNLSDVPFIKFRKGERIIITQLWNKCSLNPKISKENYIKENDIYFWIFIIFLIISLILIIIRIIYKKYKLIK